jgi:hypothetical protein
MRANAGLQKSGGNEGFSGAQTLCRAQHEIVVVRVDTGWGNEVPADSWGGAGSRRLRVREVADECDGEEAPEDEDLPEQTRALWTPG